MARTELTMSEEEFLIRQIKTDLKEGISRQVYDYLKKLAKEWNVTITNIAWIGSKPYPMQGALYQMLKNKCEKEGLVVRGILAKPVQRAEQNAKRAGTECFITLFDQKTFDEVVKGNQNGIGGIPVETIKELKEMLTHQYREEGWASPESVRMDTLHNPDYLNHMSATRAIDRTLRIIVRCPFTAESELPTGSLGELPGTFSPPETGVGDAPVARPGAAASVGVEAKSEVATTKPVDAAPVIRPGQKAIPQGEIKKIDPKKEGKLNEKQTSLAVLQWTNYCKGALLGIQQKEIDDKRGRLLRALFGKEKVEDLTVNELEEWVGLMTRKEIDIAPDAPQDAASAVSQPKEPAEKTEIKT